VIPVAMSCPQSPPDSYGDCFRACVASVLEVGSHRVPHFTDGDDPQWWAKFAAWCEERGLYAYEQLAALFTPPGYHVAIGENARGADHSVVMLGRELAYDPAGGAGLKVTTNVVCFVLADAGKFLRWKS
jgi:hypothetical protein